jgi:hypothetical protein
VVDDMRAFLSRWVKADGRTILAVGAGRKADGSRRFFHVGFDGGDVDGVEARARREDARGNDVYLALARYGSATDAKGQPRRTQENAFGCASFQVDADVKGDGYGTVREAAEAVARAGKRIGVGTPNLGVGSGHGLHAYWTFADLVPKDRWLVLAHALTEALLAEGVRFDTACTKDLARILRVPETRNWKDPDAPEQVAGLWSRGPSDVAVFEAALAGRAHGGAKSVQPAVGAFGLPGGHAGLAAGAAAPPVSGAVSAGTVAEQDELGRGKVIDLSVVRRECLIMADAMDTGGEKYAEPLWRDLLLLTLFGDEPGNDTAHSISCRHPGYSASDTDAKLEVLRGQRMQALATDRPWGPPGCGRLDELWRGQFGSNPHCAACAHRGHIKSPIYAPDRQAVAQASAVGWGGAGVAAMPASERIGAYWPDFASGGMKRVAMDPKGGEKTMPVTEYHVRGPFLAKDEHGELDLVSFWSLRDWPPGRKPGDLGHRVTMPVSHINDARLFGRVLGDHGIGLADKDRQAVRDMYAAFTTQLRQRSVVRKLPKSLGWHDAPDLGKSGDRGFVIGGKFWLADGSGIETSLAGNPVASAYVPRGEVGRWLQAATAILADPRPHPHAMLAISLGSILLPLVGMRGAVSSFVSRESGYGKTTMAWLAASAWGHPEQSTNSLNDTFNSIISRAQFVGSLPTIVDDVRPTVWEAVDTLLFRFGQGKEKMRLNGSSQLQTAGTFDGSLITTSNLSVREMVQQGKLNAAALARINEYDVPLIGAAHTAGQAADVSLTLKSNYGVFGVLYVQRLLPEVERVRTALGAFIDKLTAFSAIHATDREARFQVATAAAAIVAAVEARRLGLAIDPARVQSLVVAKLKEGKAGRVALAAAPQGVTLLVEFLEDMADSKAVVDGPDLEFLGKRLPVAYLIDRQGRRLFVDARLFSDWLVKRKMPVKATFDDLDRHHNMRERVIPIARNVAAIASTRRRTLILPCLRPPLDTLVH